jgi:transmembrane sensor
MESREHAESAAAAWIARREGDDWSAADQVELEAWIRATTDNRVAWLRLNAAWQQTTRLKSLSTTVTAGTVPTPDEIRLPFFSAVPKPGSSQLSELSRGDSLTADSDSPDLRTLASQQNGQGAAPTPLATADPGGTSSALDTSAKPSWRRGKVAGALGRAKRLRALAVAVLLASAVASTWYLAPRGPSYHTGVGSLQVIPLPEGSRVTLNTNTEIRVDVTPTERRVNLERGEAYFEVAKDPSRPFIVKAGDKRVIAVGTQFSVRRENGDVRVFVTEGKVRIEQSQGAIRPGGESAVAVLTAGSIARADADNVLVQEKSIAEVEQLLTWRTGHLVFDKTPLADAVAEFNRYNRRKIIIQDPAVAAIRVGGNFRATNVDGFVRLIASDFSITATQHRDQILLSGMPPP